MPSSHARRLILVTGLPRSGTTAIGGYLGLSSGTAVLHEPMNAQTGLSMIDRQFVIPGTGGFSEADFDVMLTGLSRLQLDYKRQTHPRDPLWRKIAARMLGARPRITYLRAKYLQAGAETLIWKDPLAVLVAPEVAQRGHDVVVTVRPPLAVAASLTRMKWGGKLDEVAGRLQALGRWPAGPLPKPLGADGFSRAENAALLWRAAHRGLIEAADSYPNMRFFSLDHMIAAPEQTLRQLYESLNLPWNTQISARLARDYRPKETHDNAEAPKAMKAHDKNRDVSAANTYWSKVLSEEEVETVRALTAEDWARVQSHFTTITGNVA